MKCYSCGKEVHEDARFCFACGANLTAVPTPAAEPAPAASVPETVVSETVVPEAPVQEAPAQPKYEYTPPVPQPQAPTGQPWMQQPVQPWAQPQAQPQPQGWVPPQGQIPVQPQPQAWIPPQGQPNTQYVYTYAPPAIPGGPQIVYVKAKTPGRGFGISSMVLGIIGLFYAFSGISALNELMYLTQFAEEAVIDFVATLIVIGIMPLLAVIFGICGRKKGYKNGVSLSGLIMGIIGLALIVIEIFVLVGNGMLG